MRLWSLHPRHLDAKGLVALWREGLLARAVLRGATKGYRRHPQLNRFRRRADPVAAIDAYLHSVADEAEARGYRFDRAKLDPATRLRPQAVGAGQLAHEWRHLLAKLRARDPACWRRARRGAPACHPSFRVVPGGVATWERALNPPGRTGASPSPKGKSSRRAGSAERTRADRRTASGRRRSRPG
jgi:hypothetical protein